MQVTPTLTLTLPLTLTLSLTLTLTLTETPRPGAALPRECGDATDHAVRSPQADEHRRQQGAPPA